MNPFEMVVLIVFMAMIAGVLKSRFGRGHEGRSRRRMRHGSDEERASVEDQAESIRLREEVKMLKERIHVLERITVDKENSLAREIDDLRDR